ncbi:MAG: heme biosynthesis protein HemY [Burkholderiales bacterium]
MMKTLLWFFGLFAGAVALVLLARHQDGYVLLVASPWRVEVSLNMAIFLTVAFCAGVYLVLRAVTLALAMPARVRAIHARRAKDQARSQFNEALTNFFEGRFGRAEKAAAAALKAGESPALASVLAARAAHGMRAYGKRDQYLSSPTIGKPVGDDLRGITRAEVLLDERRYHDALEVLRQLPAKHAAALRLELRAQQMAKNWEGVLGLVPLLEKRRVFERPVLVQLRRQANVELIRQNAHDEQSLRKMWDRLSSEHKRDLSIATAAAQGFSSLGCGADASRIIEEVLGREWDPVLLSIYAECEGANVSIQLACAERWLQTHPKDAVLLLTLGRLCARQGLWGKARRYLEASLAIEVTHAAHLELAQMSEREGNAGQAAAEYRKALEVTLLQLKSHAGGRRRAML